MRAPQELRLAVIQARADGLTDAEVREVVDAMLELLRDALRPKLEVVE